MSGTDMAARLLAQDLLSCSDLRKLMLSQLPLDEKFLKRYCTSFSLLPAALRLFS